MATVNAPNEEAIRAWNGVLFDRFVRFRHLLIAGMSPASDEAMRVHQPRPGDRALDVGCGFGDTALRLAGLVGSDGSVLGVDAAERFVAAAREEAAEAGAANVRFAVADVQSAQFEETFDYAFSRFGTMFFANPVPAMRNIRSALAPGGRLCMVVWRRKIENEWLYHAERAVMELVEPDHDSDEPTCGPGPFSMADADATSQILLNAGFRDVSLRRFDFPFTVGEGLDEAVALTMALGPAGEALRLAGDDADRLRPEIEDAVRRVLSPFEGPEGVVTTASTWIVSAEAP